MFGTWVLHASAPAQLRAQEAESLHHFAGQGDIAMLQQLLAAGAATVHDRDDDGATALHWAADRGALEAAEFLLQHGADVSAQDDTGMSALHYAACSGQREVCCTLPWQGSACLCAQLRTCHCSQCAAGAES